LFGHRKGCLAGALDDKIGTKADGGTLFLDGGDMSLKTQAKLLRSLDEQRFEPVGAAIHSSGRAWWPHQQELKRKLSAAIFAKTCSTV
jgi:two-component system nitrogen regulation response regulator NtrX